MFLDVYDVASYSLSQKGTRSASEKRRVSIDARVVVQYQQSTRSFAELEGSSRLFKYSARSAEPWCGLFLNSESASVDADGSDDETEYEEESDH